MNSIFEFEFKKPTVQNAPKYIEVRAGYPATYSTPMEPIVYYLVPKKVGQIMSGDGILEMQKKIATVFKLYKPTVFEQYFSTKIDKKLLDSITDGRYTSRTMEMVMDFQKAYVSEWRNPEKQKPIKGFGSFGGYSKKELDYWFGKAIRDLKAQNITIDKDLLDLIVH